MPAIRVRRVHSALPLVRRYELHIQPNGEPVQRVVLRRGSAVRRLERLLGIGDAWAFIRAADAHWAAGESAAVEYEWPAR